MLERIREVLKKEKAVLFAYVFGSFVRSKKYAKDIDIAVFVKGKVPPDFERRLALKLERAVGKEVDVIVINKKPTLLLSEILRNCILIFSRDEKRRVKFEMQALREILDYNELIRQFDEKRFERYGIR